MEQKTYEAPQLTPVGSFEEVTLGTVSGATLDERLKTLVGGQTPAGFPSGFLS